MLDSNVTIEIFSRTRERSVLFLDFAFVGFPSNCFEFFSFFFFFFSKSCGKREISYFLLFSISSDACLRRTVTFISINVTNSRQSELFSSPFSRFTPSRFSLPRKIYRESIYIYIIYTSSLTRRNRSPISPIKGNWAAGDCRYRIKK